MSFFFVSIDPHRIHHGDTPAASPRGGRMRRRMRPAFGGEAETELGGHEVRLLPELQVLRRRMDRTDGQGELPRVMEGQEMDGNLMGKEMKRWFDDV